MYVIPQDELYHEVYPVWTYSYLGFLVLVFLFTDLTRCPWKTEIRRKTLFSGTRL